MISLPIQSRAKAGLLVGYAVVLALLLWQHEMWLDELQAWLLVKKSANFSDLFKNTRYEGHPFLWYLLFWPFSLFTDNPAVMQLVHWMIAVGTAYLVIYKSPFRFWEKAAILFGYYFLFEYGTIARNYQIGVFLIVWIAYLWPTRNHHLIAISVLLFLLFQTNAYALLIALSISAGLLLQRWQDKKVWNWQTGILLIITGFGAVLALWTMQTPTDFLLDKGWNFQFKSSDFLTIIQNCARSLFPFPELKKNFWNTSYISNPYVLILVVVLYISTISWQLRHKLPQLAIFGISTFLILFFTYTKYSGSLRHWGHYFIVFLFVEWITIVSDKRASPSTPLFFQASLLIGLLSGMFAAYQEFKYPFYSAKEIAAYVKGSRDNKEVILSTSNYAVVALSAYLDKEIYNLNTSQFQTFTVWKKSIEATQNLTSLQKLRNFLATNTKSNLLLIDSPHYVVSDITPKLDTLVANNKTYKIHFLKAFESGIIDDVGETGTRLYTIQRL